METSDKGIYTKSEVLSMQPPCLFPLLRSKLDIPPEYPLMLSRPRLLAQLIRGQDAKVTVISAPTGFGKTTLLSTWARQSTLAVSWLSLSESDNDPVHFWSYVFYALASFSSSTTPGIPSFSAYDGPESIVAVITELAAAVPRTFALVLDDYHLIHNRQIHTALATLLRYLPTSMHLFIASRTWLPFSLARLRAERQLCELHPADLLFTLEEIELFFTCTLGRACVPGQAQTLKEHTDGWAAILQLAATWLQEQQGAPEDLLSIPDNHRYILDYLTTEVFQRQPQAMQLFLLQTSILDRFTAALCGAVTGLSHAQSMIEQATQANLFINPLDDQRHWYSYQPLFQTFLRIRLEQTLPNLIPILYRRACAWYEQQKCPAEAINYALAGRDFEKAAEIILHIGERMLIGNEVNTLLTWLKALPEELVCLYPLLCLFYAWSLMMVGQFDTAEIWIRNVDYLGRKASCHSGTQLPDYADLPVNDLETVQSVISILRAHIAIFWGDLSYVEDLTRQVQTSLTGVNCFAQCLNLLNVAVVNWLNGHMVAAEKAFTTAAIEGNRLDNTYVILAADCGLTLTHMMQGKRRQALVIAQQTLHSLAHHKHYLSPFSAYLYTEFSYLLYEWNRLDEAADYAREALAYGEKQSQDILVYSFIILSRIMFAKGDLDEARRLLFQAEHHIPYSQHRPWVISRLAEHYVPLALAYQDMQKAEYWSRLPELKHFGSLATILPMRVLLAKKQPCEARRLALLCLQDEKLQHGKLMPMILLARACQELGNLAEAARVLDDALRIAEPEGYIRFFLDEGADFSHLLRAQLEQYETQQQNAAEARIARYIHLLLDEFAREPGASADVREAAESFPAVPGIMDDLSKRELDVLRGIVAGLSNLEIAQQIVVAESTVKWHVRNIYSKLQVHNRAQAIMEARRLQLWS